ncbi:MAG: NADH-quinone oxidoreductase subunit C, partial [Gemmatimonadaceae bacterium]
MMADDLPRVAAERWPGHVQHVRPAGGAGAELTCDRDVLVEVCRWLVATRELSFAGLVVEEGVRDWWLRYVFYGAARDGWVHVLAQAPLDDRTFPSIVGVTHGANWHEREAEDLYGVRFAGHPHLGDFILHDDAWQEGVEPMRHGFSASTPISVRQPNTDWRPGRILQAPGAFAMPLGPVFAGITEPAHYLLETVGEDVVRAIPRLFYKYRGIEKLAEGRTADDVLLLAERFSATTAFAHALAYCRALEAIGEIEVPARAMVLRTFVAELERFRHHVGAIEAICESTGLVVWASQAALLEEDLLRVSGALTGHRYLFGLCVPGGLATDLADAACRAAA